MSCYNYSCQVVSNTCTDAYNCSSQCPDFQIKRYDTMPSFVVAVSDCDGPLDLTDTVVEVNMWAKAKFKKAVTADDTYFALADNIGFNQSLVGDVIVVDRVRGPEHMLVIGHDETNNYVEVERGYNGTAASAYKKGASIRIFRVLNSMGDTRTVEEDVEQIDGTTETITTESQLIYNWQAKDTCVPGCFFLEFKLIKMDASAAWLSADATPYFTTVTPASAGCELGVGVEWVRRFPFDKEGFLVKVFDSPTTE